MHKKYRLTEIINFLSSEVISVYGDFNKVFVDNISDSSNVNELTLDWISNRQNNKQRLAESSKAKAIITNNEITYTDIIKQQGKILIIVKNPKLSLAKLGNHFFTPKIIPNIHPTAVIHPEADIADNVYIGPYCTIGKATIGESCTLNSNVVLYDNTILEQSVLIHSGSVIGTDGLGCEREEDGTLIKFPHRGGVIIRENVEIGALCNIARGVFSSTTIGSGSKINGQCFIAHNCTLGSNVWITGKSMLAGSVVIEDNVTIFSNVIIRDQRVIGKGATIGMGSVVTKNVPAGETWLGNPAKKIEK